MKKILMILAAIFISIALAAQTENSFKYVIKAKGGITNTKKGLNADKIDSVKVSGTTVTTYQGTTILTPAINAADQVEGVKKADTTGNAPGNYMTRENYHNDPSQSTMMKGLRGFGVGIKGFPVGLVTVEGAITLYDTRRYSVLVYIPEKELITGVKWVANVAGIFVADSVDAVNGFALYKLDAAGTTGTKVASTENNANVWRVTAITVGTKAFTSTYTAEAGYYRVSFLYNSVSVTTAPKIYGNTGVDCYIMNTLLTSNKYISSSILGQSAFPDTELGSDMSIRQDVALVVLY